MPAAGRRKKPCRMNNQFATSPAGRQQSGLIERLFLAEDADGLDASGAVGGKNSGKETYRDEKKGHGREGERVGGADAEDEGGDDATERERSGEAECAPPENPPHALADHPYPTPR